MCIQYVLCVVPLNTELICISRGFPERTDTLLWGIRCVGSGVMEWRGPAKMNE